ncbi:MAG: MBL fold metallo-hydrolase [Blastochloris sp.]|nr:MBL fold metallo-hydrolase [Blastochloris sp.]
MRVTLLGTGTSQGVPMIACDCEVCQSSDPKDHRFRCSAWVQSDDLSILIDTTPDLRSQALRAGIRHLDAVVCTHAHNDHLIGFDDLRRFCDRNRPPLSVYCSSETHERLLTVFPYAFQEDNSPYNSYVRAQAHVFDGPFELGALRFVPVLVPHGRTLTHGFILEENGIRHLAYIPDCAALTESMTEALRDIPVLIIDGLRDKPHPTHMNVPAALAAACTVRAGTTYLTHLTHDISHAQRSPLLPENVFLAYDGLVLDFPT